MLKKELNVTALHVTHSKKDAEILADQIIYIENGKIV